jgi:hypothetical protein
MKFSEKLKQYALTTLGNMYEQGGAELKRLGTQGAMEMANALFNGFVPYGPGQYTPDTPDPAKKQTPEPEQQQDQGREI